MKIAIFDGEGEFDRNRNFGLTGTPYFWPKLWFFPEIFDVWPKLDFFGEN